jgi:hypothetical protein
MKVSPRAGSKRTESRHARLCEKFSHGTKSAAFAVAADFSPMTKRSVLRRVKHASSRRRLRYGTAVLFLCYDSTGATSAGNAFHVRSRRREAAPRIHRNSQVFSESKFCSRRLSEHKLTTRPSSTPGEARLEHTPSAVRQRRSVSVLRQHRRYKRY